MLLDLAYPHIHGLATNLPLTLGCLSLSPAPPTVRQSEYHGTVQISCAGNVCAMTMSPSGAYLAMLHADGVCELYSAYVLLSSPSPVRARIALILEQCASEQCCRANVVCFR